MLKLKIVELTLQRLMLACLTLVELLREDGLPTGNTRREVTAALPAVDVIFSYACLALLLGAVEFLLSLVEGWVPREEVDCEHFVCLTLLLGNFRQSFQFDEGFRTVFEAIVEITGKGH